MSFKPVAPEIKITQHGQGYLLQFEKDHQMINLIKNTLPSRYRSFTTDPIGWLVHPDSLEILLRAIEDLYEVKILRPGPIILNVEPQTKIFRLEYVGSCKERGEGKKSAYGTVGGKQWAVEFPEEVLKTFFAGKVALKPDQELTFYQILLIGEDAKADEIKSSYRRLARQWHPDLCKEPEASEKFREIDEAYKLLSDPLKRNKYNAGLYFQRKAEERENSHYTDRRGKTRKWKNNSPIGYRAPFTSGEVTVKGIQAIGKFLVEEILHWDDLKDSNGRVAVSSWRKGEDSYRIVWA